MNLFTVILWKGMNMHPIDYEHGLPYQHVSVTRVKERLYRIQILCRRHPFWSYPAGLTIAEPPG